VAIPQTVASAGAINLFIVTLVCIAKTTRVLSQKLDDADEVKSWHPMTWGSNALPDGGKLVNRVRDASSISFIVTSKSIIFKCCNEDQIK
jgi:hypothetical protein